LKIERKPTTGASRSDGSNHLCQLELALIVERGKGGKGTEKSKKRQSQRTTPKNGVFSLGKVIFFFCRNKPCNPHIRMEKEHWWGGREKGIKETPDLRQNIVPTRDTKKVRWGIPI